MSVYKGDLPFRVVKCTSHGKDEKQDPGITSYNAMADVCAKAAARLPKGFNLPEVVGEQDYHLKYRGVAVRSDPRKHIGRSAAIGSFAHACTLSSGGVVAGSATPTPLLST